MKWHLVFETEDLGCRNKMRPKVSVLVFMLSIPLFSYIGVSCCLCIIWFNGLIDETLSIMIYTYCTSDTPQTPVVLSISVCSLD